MCGFMIICFLIDQSYIRYNSDESFKNRYECEWTFLVNIGLVQIFNYFVIPKRAHRTLSESSIV